MEDDGFVMDFPGLYKNAYLGALYQISELNLNVLDSQSLEILSCVYGKARGAQEISERQKIPIAQVYRRIHILEDAGLLKCSSYALTQKGKRIRLYISLVKHIFIFFKSGQPEIRIVFKDVLS